MFAGRNIEACGRRAVKNTLRSSADFSRVLRRGRTVTTSDVVLHILGRSDGLPGRYGMVVPKKDRGAVSRNRARRQIRAAVMLAGGFGEQMDGVVSIRKGRKIDVHALSAQITGTRAQP